MVHIKIIDEQRGYAMVTQRGRLTAKAKQLGLELSSSLYNGYWLRVKGAGYWNYDAFKTLNSVEEFLNEFSTI